MSVPEVRAPTPVIPVQPSQGGNSSVPSPTIPSQPGQDLSLLALQFLSQYLNISYPSLTSKESQETQENFYSSFHPYFLTLRKEKTAPERQEQQPTPPTKIDPKDLELPINPKESAEGEGSVKKTFIALCLSNIIATLERQGSLPIELIHLYRALSKEIRQENQSTPAKSITDLRGELLRALQDPSSQKEIDTLKKQSQELLAAPKPPGQTKTIPQEIVPLQLRLLQNKVQEMSLPISTKASVIEVRSLPQLQSLFSAASTHSDKLPLTFIVPYPAPFSPASESAASSKEGRGGSKAGQKKEATKELHMTLVPKGPVLLGDPFEEGESDERPVRLLELGDFCIGIFPITNFQYASWLTERLRLKQIEYAQGEIFGSDGKLLCKTVEAAPTSQLQMSLEGEMLCFTPLKHTEKHPVVQVSWHGAAAFCKTYGFQLLSELQWEKAAGMALPLYNNPPKKFRYSFGKDEIEETLANYRKQFSRSKVPENLTTPSGFYNGEAVFAQGHETLVTQKAVSPYGCYDMSGNVREWTEACIVKGGSYDTPPAELRVSARELLPPDHTDHHTGFRVALELPR